MTPRRRDNYYSFKTFEEKKLDFDGYPFTVKFITIDVASLTFLNGNQEPVDVPNNIRLRDLDGNAVIVPILQSFFITWIGSSSLFDGETELVRMTNQKQHSISGPKINDSRTYVNGILKSAK